MCLHAQIEYFLRKLTEAMGGSWVEERFEDYKTQLNSKQKSLNAWELIILVGSGHFSKGMDRQTLSMGINEVYQELIMDVLKQVGNTPAKDDDTVSVTDCLLRSIPFVTMPVLLSVLAQHTCSFANTVILNSSLLTSFFQSFKPHIMVLISGIENKIYNVS